MYKIFPTWSKILKLAKMSLETQNIDSVSVLGTIEAGEKERTGMGEGMPEK